MNITKPRPGERVELESIDFTRTELFVHGDPHLAWRTLREEAPVYRHSLPDGSGYWSVTKLESCCQVLADHTVFTSARGALLKMLGIDDPAGGRQMALSDPPRHTHLRRPLQRMLTSSAVEAHAPTIRARIADLVAPLLEGAPFDLGAAMCTLPMLVSGILLGLPESTYPDLVRWGLMTVAPDDPEFADVGTPHDVLQEAHRNLFAYFADQVAQRRGIPEDELASRDLIGRLMTMDVEGKRLGDGDVVSNCYSILLGANVNTGHVVTAALLELAERQSAYATWSRDPRRLQLGIREALRWSSPVTHFLRYARADVELEGRRIESGEPVVAWIASANRDEDVFDRPFDFDLERQPNRHIAFGVGPHTCIGTAPALLSLRCVFELLVEGVEGWELLGEPEHLQSNFTAGIKHLPVAATPRGRSGREAVLAALGR